jgi:hypothetical protein
MTAGDLEKTGNESEAPRNVGPAPRVFLSYRRKDTQDVVEVLSRRLRDDLGSRNVYRDREDLIAGQDWQSALNSAIDESDAALVLIGDEWAGEDDEGNPRLGNEDDPVRLEVERVLDEDTRPNAVPVLVDVERPPRVPAAAEQLIEELSRKHFARVSRSSVDDRASTGYQGVLVGVWESLRQLHPRAVLIIGDDVAQGSLDRLVAELADTNAIDASVLSRFASGAVIVNARKARRGAKQWPDVIFAVDESASDILTARVTAAYQNKAIRRVALAGAGATALALLLTQSGVAAAAASTGTSVATYTSAAQLSSALPTTSSTLAGSIGSAWANAALGVKIGIVAGAVVAGGATVAVVTNSSDTQIDYPDRSTLAATREDDRDYPLGVPADVTVELGPAIPTDEDNAPWASSGSESVSREVTLHLFEGEPPIPLGPVVLPVSLSTDFVDDRLREGHTTITLVEAMVPLPREGVPTAAICFVIQDPSIVTAGYLMLGGQAMATVHFRVTTEGGSLIGSNVVVVIDGATRKVPITESPSEIEESNCPEEGPGSVSWELP